MEYTMLELQIFAIIVCFVACGWTSWKIGHHAGIVSALEYLEAEGVVTFDEE